MLWAAMISHTTLMIALYVFADEMHDPGSSLGSYTCSKERERERYVEQIRGNM